jgi:hypothetical protein
MTPSINASVKIRRRVSSIAIEVGSRDVKGVKGVVRYCDTFAGCPLDHWTARFSYLGIYEVLRGI